MNTNTGELISAAAAEEFLTEKGLERPATDEEQREALKNPGYEPVPEEREEEALRELGCKDNVTVDMEKDTPLVRWAKTQNRINKRKVRRKLTKAGRRANRK